MLPAQTCLCPVAMSIHVHAYKHVSMYAETPAGMGRSAQMLFSQRGQQRPDTFASKAQMRKWKVRERPDLPHHKASSPRLDSKSEPCFPLSGHFSSPCGFRESSPRLRSASETHTHFTPEPYILFYVVNTYPEGHRGLTVSAILKMLQCLLHHRAQDPATSSILVPFRERQLQEC